jgi:hypothetical protein
MESKTDVRERMSGVRFIPDADMIRVWVPKRGERRMKSILIWVALIVAGVALLIAAVGAILALLAGHARFIEVAWISIAASLFVLACDVRFAL